MNKKSNLRYNSFNNHLKKYFGEKVYKIPIDAHIPCPNKDGRISKNGCIFCDKYGSGPIKTGKLSIEEQIEKGIKNIGKKYKAKKFLAYFQANTNTGTSVKKIKKMCETALNYKEITGISIGTRPDWIFKEHFNYFKELNKKTYLWIELGLQSIHSKSLKFLRRNHSLADFIKTFLKLNESQIKVCAHSIIGIPGETHSDMMETAKFLSAIGVDGVKIHLLHILKNTDLENLYQKGIIKLLSLEEYIKLVADYLEYISSEIIIQRLTGERDREIFVAPKWALNKGLVIQRIREELIKRNSYQGKKIDFSINKKL